MLQSLFPLLFPLLPTNSHSEHLILYGVLLKTMFRPLASTLYPRLVYVLETQTRLC